MYKERKYRNWVKKDDLVTFEVKEKETDLFISAAKDLRQQARSAILTYRKDIEGYIKGDPDFFTTLEPMGVRDDAPAIIKTMVEASSRAGVGPMAAIAGAIAECVGRELAAFSDEVIVENGGDIYVRSKRQRVFGIYAGEHSPFTGNLALELDPASDGMGVCTSSGTVSHSLSFGNADAALIISKNTALADAMATATGNMVKGPEDIYKAIDFAKSIEGIVGVLIIIKDKIGTWGEICLI